MEKGFVFMKEDDGDGKDDDDGDDFDGEMYL